MKARACPIAIAVIAGLMLSPTLQAKPKKDKGQPSAEKWIESVTGWNVSKDKKKRGKNDDVLSRIFNGNSPGKSGYRSNDPMQLIRDYIFGYQQRDDNPKGLPPGLAKKVARGGELPPGWQKKVYPGTQFPSELFPFSSRLNDSQIPNFRRDDSVDYYSIGNRIVKLRQSDNRILDTFDF